jgi:uncharacterized repeat protein (TIGR01451 family)
LQLFWEWSLNLFELHKALRAVLAAAIVMVAVCTVFSGAANAATLDWGTLANNTNLISGTSTSTVSGVTITAHVTTAGTFDVAPIAATSTGSSNGSLAGIINLSMDAKTDDRAAFMLTTITFSKPVTNVSITVRDIDGGPAYNGWDDVVDFNSSAGVPTSGTPGTGVNYNALTGQAYSKSNIGISNATGNMTVTWAVPVTSITIKYISAEILNTPQNPSGQLLVIDDLLFSLMPTVAVKKTSTGAVGTFNFDVSNSGTGTTATTVTTATAGTPVTGTAIQLLALNTTTTLTETGPAGWVFNPASSTCTDSNSATSGNPATFAASVVGYVITIPATNVKAEAIITCAITNAKVPTLQLAKLSVGTYGAFSFNGDNGFGSDIITTVSPGIPANGTLRSLSAAATTTTITETIPAGWVATSASCTGTPSANVSFTAATGVLVLNAAATAASNNLVCTFTNTKLPSVSIQKTTTGGLGGPFTFSQTGLTSTPASISTTAAATPTPSSPTPIIATIGTAVSLTEGIATGYLTSGVVCTDTNSGVTGNAPISSATASISIPGTNIKVGASYNCLFTNAVINPQLTIVKTANTAGPVPVSTLITYTYKVTNSGNVPITNVSVVDTHNGNGTFLGVNNEALTTSVSGLSTDASVNNGIWSTIGPGDTVTFTATYSVTQHDIDFLQ